MFNYKFSMITTRIKGRLAILCIICTLACMSFLLTTAPVNGTALAADFSPNAHINRDWQIAQVSDVFVDTVLMEDSVSSIPVVADSRQSSGFSFEEPQYAGEGVVLLSYQVHPLHSRNWQIEHV